MLAGFTRTSRTRFSVALKAGSAVGFTLKETVTLDTLQERLRVIESAGIGLRRHEGFGQVVFNHPFYQDNGCDIITDDIYFRDQDARQVLRLGHAQAAAKLLAENLAALRESLTSLVSLSC